MDSNNLAENDLIWSKKNSSKNGWRWFLAGTLLNLTVTSLIVGSMLFYVHVELQSFKDQLLSHEDRLFILEEHVTTTNDDTLQQGTPGVNDQTWKKAQLRMRRDHKPKVLTEDRADGNWTFQSGIHTSQTEPLHGPHFQILTCRDGKDGKDGKDGRDGKSGEAGRDGDDGRDGRDCQAGQPGEPGPPGERGIPGERGQSGEPGPSGPMGPPGESGVSGEMGRPGKAGPSGRMGTPGVSGVSGEMGRQGEAGPSGPMGPPGVSGVSGEMGRPGESGRPGQQGLDGRQCNSSGPTYIRWGRTTCPNQAGTELVYQGYGAGAHYTHNGGSADLFCLPTDPDVPASYRDGFQGNSRLYGMEYEVNSYDPFSHENSEVLHNHDVPCAVCRLTSRGTQVLFPAKNECPDDNWTKEYKGYLMSQNQRYKRQQAVCVDVAPEVIPGSQTDTNGALLYLIEAACGSLPCPPYAEGREMSCTICSI